MLRRPPISTLFPYTTSSDLFGWSSAGQGWSHVLLCRLALLLQLFCLVVCRERTDQRIEPAFHHLVQLIDRKSTRLNSSHVEISYAVFCLKKKNGSDNSHFLR